MKLIKKLELIKALLGSINHANKQGISPDHMLLVLVDTEKEEANTAISFDDAKTLNTVLKTAIRSFAKINDMSVHKVLDMMMEENGEHNDEDKSDKDNKQDK